MTQENAQEGHISSGEHPSIFCKGCMMIPTVQLSSAASEGVFSQLNVRKVVG